MGLEYDPTEFARIQQKLENFLDGMAEDLELVGEVAADEIIRSTLAGIGEGDNAFAPYSQSYLAQIEAVGGKPGGVVNLRGIFLKQGDKLHSSMNVPTRQQAIERDKRMLRRGGGRRAYVAVSRGGKTFNARTATTRPMRGLQDAQSEMSRDRIFVQSKPDKIILTYRPRKQDYMILHQKGEAKGGKARVWFTFDKGNVKSAMLKTLTELMEARIAAFNDPNVQHMGPVNPS